ncbi:S41 family peptidase [Desulfobacterales bacterium HSG16]|nr:S41 family peptidase [Desulfobacterales bacterium HSG16]
MNKISNTSQSPSTNRQWTEDEDMLIYFEAVTKISKNALSRPRHEDIVKNSIKSYLKTLDPFSDYLDSSEYALFRKFQKNDYTGLGMEIEKNSSDQIICIPYPGSNAEKAGIEFGDVIEKIDGSDVSNKSLLTIASMIRGEEGSRIDLVVSNKKGRQKKIRARRSAIESNSVESDYKNGIQIIKISRFAIDTQRTLKYEIEDLEKSQPVVIDLRDNPGGDLHSAIDCAMLFLDKGKSIVTIKKVSETKPYKSLKNSTHRKIPVFLWQNDKTASAAEVFIAALTQNGRAESIGKKTYGKGTVQDIIELSNGSAILLTSGYLQTPDGSRYHEKGLEPFHPVKQKKPGTTHYMKMVTKLLKKNKSDSRKDEVTRIDVPISSDDIDKDDIDKDIKSDDAWFICFDKYFNTEVDARYMALNVVKSLNKPDGPFVFQARENNEISYFVCLGPYGTKVLAEEKIQEISEKMNISMFMRKGKDIVEAPEDQIEN